ncbi:MAG: accessory factor UbiK family protein [Pseudomonadota bacterium]
MQTENKFIDDLSRVASSALGVVAGLREEAEAAFRARLEQWLAGMDLVTREDFEAVKAMAAKARAENEALEKRIKALEATVAARPKPRAKAKSAAKAKAPPKAAAAKSEKDGAS